jgi:hypothetical protein
LFRWILNEMADADIELVYVQEQQNISKHDGFLKQKAAGACERQRNGATLK